MSGMTKRHGVPTILAATAVTLLLAACGSNGDDASADQPDDAKRLAFAQCMRKAGLEFKDETSAGGRRTMQMQVPKGIPPARVQKIQSDCSRKTGGGPREPSKEEQAKFLDLALKFARCMRAHGVDMPDPKAQGGGIVIQKGSGGEGIDPTSSAFKSAQKECAEFQPGGKGGGPAGTFRSGSGGSGPGLDEESP